MKIIDPQLAVLEGVAGEPALESKRLNLDWITTRFAHPPVWTPEQTDEQRYPNAAQTRKNAAVLVALIQHADGIKVLLTRRTAHLSHHAGQISFPGGATEPADRDATETALREAEEEIGLARARVAVIGQMPVYQTITGFQVTPVVATTSSLGPLHADQHEVDEIFEVPLAFLMDGASHQIRSIVVDSPAGTPLKRSFYAMPYQDYFIWGATAAMLRNLFHFLRA